MNKFETKNSQIFFKSSNCFVFLIFSEGRISRRLKTIIGDFVKDGAPVTVSDIGKKCALKKYNQF